MNQTLKSSGRIRNIERCRNGSDGVLGSRLVVLQRVGQDNRVSLRVVQPETATQRVAQLVMQPHADCAQAGSG